MNLVSPDEDHSMEIDKSLPGAQDYPSLVSKRAALFEQKPTEAEQKPLTNNLRWNSFSKSTISPGKTVLNKSRSSPQEDPEIFSSGSSTSPHSILRKQLDSQNFNSNTAPSPEKDNLDPLSPNPAEPSKLSLSEKMKLFSAPLIQPNKSLNPEPNKNKQLKRSMTRFQTQVCYSNSYSI